MVKILRAASATFLFLLQASSACAASAFPLSDLEKAVADAPSVRIARLAESAQASALNGDRAQQKGRLTIGAAAGGYRELVTQTLARNYVSANGIVGVRFPFVSSLEDKETLLHGDTLLAERHIDGDIARRGVLRALRTQYAAYWAAQRKTRFAESFLNDERRTESALSIRAGTHQAFAFEHMEITSNYDAARRDAAQFSREAHHALMNLGILIGKTFPPFVPDEPQITPFCNNASTFTDAVLANNPALITLRAQLHEAESLAAAARRLPFQAGITIDQSAVGQMPGGSGLGYATTASVDLSIPLEARRIASNRREQYAALTRQLQEQIALQSAQMRADAQDVFLQQKQDIQNTAFAQSRRAAADEALRERMLRYGRLSGDTLEQVAQTRYAFYQTAVTEAEARSQLAAHIADAAALSSDHCAAPANDANSAPTQPMLSAYAWRIAPLLEGPSTLWSDLRRERINVLFISLNAAQIKDMENDARHRDALTTFIAAAHAHDVTIGLLLGEAHWLLPESRDALLAIVRGLSAYPFDVLHLDIEPAQLTLPGRPPASLLPELLRTFEAVGAISPWPIDISVHYRDMRSVAPDFCFACSLAQANVRTVTLMTYITDPMKIASIVRPIIDANPHLRFRVAQSVEANLPSHESYAVAGKAAFLRASVTLRTLLTEPNFDGVVVQSYDDYKAMKP
jgi:hypothetical protein